MAKFKWDKDKITANEITEALISQYGLQQHIVITMDNMEEPVSYEKCLVGVHCNRCDASFNMSPRDILNSYALKNYVCSTCGNMLDEELREMKRSKMLEAGLELAKQSGVDLEGENAEEEQPDEHEVYSEETLSQMNEVFDPSIDVDEEDLPQPVQSESNQTRQVQSTESDNSIKTIELDEDFEEDTLSEYSYNEEDDKTILGESLDLTQEEKSFIENASEKELDTDSDDDMNNSQSDETIEEEPDEDPEEYVMLDGVKYTVDQLHAKVKEFAPKVTSALGYFPYDERNIKYNNNNLILTCKCCGGEVSVKKPEDLVSKIYYMTRENCLKSGLIYKPGNVRNKPNEPIYHCTKCERSIKTNGYNEYVRNYIERLCSKANLNIIDVETYWFANMGDIITVECNGIIKTCSLIDIIRDYTGKDARTLEEFTPKGTPEKSTTVHQTTINPTQEFTDTNTKNESVGNKTTKFVRSSDITDSNKILDNEKERQRETVESKSVFQVNQKIKSRQQAFATISKDRNPFQRDQSLEAKFENSVFNKFINILSEETGIKYKLLLSSETLEIPLIDFESGLRLICIDIDIPSLVRVPYERLNYVPFAWRHSSNKKMELGKDYFTHVLYSDSVIRRRDATLDALIKYINPNILPYGDKQIRLTDEMMIQYTDDRDLLKEFDSSYCTFPSGKPRTGQLGVVATWVKSSGRKADTRSVMELMAVQQGKMDLNKLGSTYDQYVAASIKYIERYNNDTGRVVYLITDYIEIGSAIIADGLIQCLRALIKEYRFKYPAIRDVPPHIKIELDQSLFLSPSIPSLIKDGILVEVDDAYNSMIDGNSDDGTRYQMYNGMYAFKSEAMHLRYSYVRRVEYRTGRDSDYCRQDIRLFNPTCLAKSMPEELKAAHISNGIKDNNTRLAFINSMGFMKSNQVPIREFFVSQITVMALMSDGKTEFIQKLASQDQLSQTGGMVTDSADGFNINSIMSNPMLLQRYTDVMNNMDDDARAYYMSNMYPQYYQQQSQMGMNQMGMNQMGMGMMGNPMMGNQMGMGMMGNPMMGNQMGMGMMF